jgi:predicted CXXCH cytochrome family protein
LRDAASLRALGRAAPLAVTALAPVAVLLSLSFGFDPVAADAARPAIHRDGGYAGASGCAACHPEHFATWQRTFHRTMTQLPETGAVLGDFDGAAVDLFGGTARPFRAGDGFFIEVPDGTGGRRAAQVALAVGSRRYQQYFERVPRGDGSGFVRLPLLWHVSARRWMHLNGVFLEPDSDDWSTHRSLWNENCIFCHNTAPRPGMLNWDARPPSAARSFDSRVAELGIACEACHGPGHRHAEKHRAPAGRYAAWLSSGADEDVVHPAKLEKEAAVAVCGQCHGQRLPRPHERIATWMQAGPTYRPGERLDQHAEPLTRDTPSVLADAPTLFADRFWPDGTARLTAYEYQGVVASPCYVRGDMTCGSCHTMHGGDVHGMLEPRMRGNDACLQCHGEIGRDVAAHTGHDAAGPGSACMECHMPRVVYGILGLHRSHRVEVPDPARDGEAGRPHACTLCHLDRDLAWSAVEMRRLWPGSKTAFRAPERRGDPAPLDLADGLASVLCGDPVQRAVYAHAFGRDDGAVSDAAAFRRVALIATLFDAYPSIRWLAQQSLLRLEGRHGTGLTSALLAWRHDGERQARDAEALRMFDVLRAGAASLEPPRAGSMVRPDFSPDMDALLALLDRQSKRVISIGE